MRIKDLFILLISLLMSVFPVTANEGKIKYGKNVYYQGEIINKEPNGQGSLVILQPDSKNEVYAEIKGLYNGLSKIENTQIISRNISPLSIQGTGTISLNSEKNQITSFTLHFANAVSHILDDNLRFAGLKVIGELGYYGWNFAFKSEPFEWMKEKWNGSKYLSDIEKEMSNSSIIGELTSATTLPTLEDHKWVVSHIVKSLYFNSSYGYDEDKLSDFKVKKTIYVLTTDCGYIYEDKDQKDTFLNIASGYSFTISKDGNWEGTRVLENTNSEETTLITKLFTSSKDLQISTYKSTASSIAGTEPLYTYRGTIENYEGVVNGTFKSNDIKYITGEFKENGHTYRWANGIAEKDIRKQLLEHGVSSNILIEDVLNGKLSINNAIVLQQRRNNEFANASQTGHLPNFDSLKELQSFINFQTPLNKGYIDNYQDVQTLCKDDPAVEYFNGDALDKEIYRQSTKYKDDAAKFRNQKDGFFMFEIPIGKVIVDGNSFKIPISRGWFRNWCKTRRENYMLLSYSAHRHNDYYHFLFPVKPQYLEKKYGDFASEALRYSSDDLSFLKKIRDAQLIGDLSLYIVFKPGCVKPRILNPQFIFDREEFYLRPYGLYLVNSTNGKILANLSYSLGKYSLSSIENMIREQTQYEKD